MENGPQNLTILDGKDATLTCNAVAAPIPNTTWIYNGRSSIANTPAHFVQININILAYMNKLLKFENE